MWDIGAPCADDGLSALCGGLRVSSTVLLPSGRRERVAVTRHPSRRLEPKRCGARPDVRRVRRVETRSDALRRGVRKKKLYSYCEDVPDRGLRAQKACSPQPQRRARSLRVGR